ncbi:hypothetical protein JHK82_054156 [Glycine max]|nr:hypothetical protein JHK86_054003 [Glycine max]KAG4916505.1 hypothetical protein JHK87_054062 [Glycine soja]KAG5083990.1 hypothetical protein JHK84_054028 [Glycine max]KAG5086759.1 hypothetical protein JHK82_054156 [Glycine max]
MARELSFHGSLYCVNWVTGMEEINETVRACAREVVDFCFLYCMGSQQGVEISIFVLN